MSHKEIIRTFLTMIIAGDIQLAFDQFSGEPFTHHNQYTKPGKQELIAGMAGNHDNFPEKSFDIEMMVEEGDRVITYSTMKFNPSHTGLRVVHIFRFEGDKIVEMRDVAMQLEENSPNK